MRLWEEALEAAGDKGCGRTEEDRGGPEGRTREKPGAGLIEVVELLILGLAAFRISRLLIEDTIAAPFRDWLLTNWPGTNVEYEEKDRHRVRGGTFEIGGTLYASTPTVLGDRISKLIGCYACTGFWVSLGLALGFYFFPRGTLYLSIPFALSGIVWLLALLQEKLEED